MSTVESRYELACKNAATNQGLDDLHAHLTDAGVEHEIEQTGGFSMVLTARTRAGVIGCISEAEWNGITGTGRYLTIYYPGDSWYDCELEGVNLGMHTPEAVAEIMGAA